MTIQEEVLRPWRGWPHHAPPLTKPKEQKENRVCAEPKKPGSPPPSKSVLEFPCKGQGSKAWALTEAKVEEWSVAFPGVGVLAEALRAKQWLLDNPNHQKTHQGMPAYLGRWFARVQDRGPRIVPGRMPLPKAPQGSYAMDGPLPNFDLDVDYPPDEPEPAFLTARSSSGGSRGHGEPQDEKTALPGPGQ